MWVSSVYITLCRNLETKQNHTLVVCLFVFVVNDDSVDFAVGVVVVFNQDISESEHTIIYMLLTKHWL